MEQQTKARAAKATASAAAIGLCMVCLPQFEGVVLRARPDPIGIITGCVGETKHIITNRTYTRDECLDLLRNRLDDYVKDDSRCVDFSRLTVGQQAAVISFSYNVGSDAFCRSSFARRLPDLSACAELSRWTKAGGRELPGLVTRRARERAICEGHIG